MQVFAQDRYHSLNMVSGLGKDNVNNTVKCVKNFEGSVEITRSTLNKGYIFLAVAYMIKKLKR